MPRASKKTTRFLLNGISLLLGITSCLFGLYGFMKMARTQRPKVEIKLRLGSQTKTGPLQESLQSLTVPADYIIPASPDANRGICASDKRLIATNGHYVVSCDLSHKPVDRVASGAAWHFTQSAIRDLAKFLVKELPDGGMGKEAATTAAVLSRVAFTIAGGLFVMTLICAGIARVMKPTS